MLRAIVLVLALIACATAQNCNGLIAPRGCISTSASWSNPVSTSPNLVCYQYFDSTYGSCNNVGPDTFCPCNSPVVTYADQNLPTEFPQQIRWGAPFETYKSGFGFRPAPGTPVAAPGKLFYFGRLTHMNYLITAGPVTKWNMDMLVSLRLPGVDAVQTSTFTMSLSLDETVNVADCQAGSTCKGTAYWDANPDALVRSECVKCSESVFAMISCGTSLKRDDLDGRNTRTVIAGSPCCPFRTPTVPPSIDEFSCSDRVSTLSPFSATSVPFNISGLQYQIYLAGFAVPGTSGLTSRSYFISQEKKSTEAELFGMLVVKCPVGTGACNGGRLVPSADGTQCVCDCSSAPSCSGGMVVGLDCKCQCPVQPGQGCLGALANASGLCVAGCLPASSGCCVNPYHVPNVDDPRCGCVCPADSTCPAGQVRDRSSYNCSCVCPPCAISGQKGDPENACQCRCPATGCTSNQEPYLDGGECKCRCKSTLCAAPKVPDAGCNACACPSACSAPKSVQSDANCACSCPPCTGSRVRDDPERCTCKCATSCASPKVNDANCNCVCPTPIPTCSGAKSVYDPATCSCVCPSCLGAQVRSNNDTCACACPACPGNAVLLGSGTDCQCGCPACFDQQVVDPLSGDACSCVCPESACTGGLVPALVQTSSCACRCPPTQCASPRVQTYPSAGAAPTSFSQCGCACDPSLCALNGPGSQLIDGSDSCACTCPSDFCGNNGVLVDAQAPIGACECDCPACSPDPNSGFVQDEKCGCSCPLDQAACSALNRDDDEYTFDAATCSCTCSRAGGGTCGCTCTPQTADCFTVSATCNATDQCPRVFHAGKQCSGVNNACTQNRCTSTGLCRQSTTDCAPTLAAVTAVHRVCYGVGCDTSAGCQLSFSAGGSCSLDLATSFGSDAQCFVSRCSAGTVAGAPPAGGCAPVFQANQQCVYDWTAGGFSAADQSCNVAQCVPEANGCRPVGVAGAACALSTAELTAQLGNNAADAMCFTSGCKLDAASGKTKCAPKFNAAFTCSLDLPAIVGAEHAQCYTVACDASQGAQGGCKAVFHDGQPCVLDVLSADPADAQCLVAVCSEAQCRPQPNDAFECERNLTALFGAVNAQCYSNDCVDGACVSVFAAGAPCTLESLAPNADDAQCFMAVCNEATKSCAATFDATRSCSLSETDLCHTTACQNNKCTRVFDASRVCSVDPSIVQPACFVAGCTPDGCGHVYDASQTGLLCPSDVDLSTVAPDAASVQCYSSVCAPPAGCTPVFNGGASCTLNLTLAVGANNATCFSGSCVDGACRPVFNPFGYCTEGTGATPGDAGCYQAVCSEAANGCVWLGIVNASCNDDDLCTVDPTLVDPVTGSPSDRCVLASDGESLNCVGSVSPCVDAYAAQKNMSFYECVEEYAAKGQTGSEYITRCTKAIDALYTEACAFKCFSDVTGQFCVSPCGVPASKSKSDRAAIIAGVVVGLSACLFIMVVLAFGYVRWGHQKLMSMLQHNDFGGSATQDNALYVDQGGEHENPIAE